MIGPPHSAQDRALIGPPHSVPGRVAYFDCYSGISGDMALGALVDAGLDADVLQAEIARLGLPDVEVKVERAERRGLAGTHVRVNVGAGRPVPRQLADIETIIGTSSLEPAIKQRAIAVFRRLGQVEAEVHGIPVDQVHFHEVGAVDAIVDIVGFAIGLHHLGIAACYASSLPMGHGMVQTAHGALPLPAPATLGLLASVGAPIHHVDIASELVTPTGAALLAETASFARPPIRIHRVGTGLGTRELPWPNALRLWLGELTEETPPESPNGGELDEGESVVLETNLDDATPEEIAFAMERLFAAGALDVFFTPAQMKKNRPGIQLTVIATPALAGALAHAILRETTSLGVRFSTVQRLMCPRRAATVTTRFGRLAVKIKQIDGEEIICPEFEECARISRERNVPIREVYAAVLSADLGAEDETRSQAGTTGGPAR
jgi:pyridinium-3,5-bisthiocarboxylic acid mononucleotide nickel chelatase